MKWGFPISINLLFWFIIGLFRRIDDKRRNKKREKIVFISPGYQKKLTRQIAVCISAKNEEKTIKKTLRSVKKNTHITHCYLISDGSSDKTASVARKEGAHVKVNKVSQGKAQALKTLIDHFKLLKKYEYILFLDADSQIDKNYIKNALILLEDPKVSCIAGFARNQWNDPLKINLENLIVAYRARLYSLLQYFLVFAQTWRFTNVTPIVPGFASIYRTGVLKEIDMVVPNMAIEDFNWTFQVRKKKLGLVAQNAHVSALAQDPTTLHDYIHQVERWNIGFFQAVRYNGVWLSMFWFFLFIFIAEVFLSVFFLSILPIILFFLSYDFFADFSNPRLIMIDQYVNEYFLLWGIFIGVFVIDYFLTIFVAIKDKKPLMAVYGFGFLFLRLIDSVILIISTIKSFNYKTNGSWTSPKRI